MVALSNFCESLMSAFLEDSWIFISASPSNLLQYVVLIEVDEEYSVLQRYRYVVVKGGNIWNDFSDHCEHFAL